MLRVIRRFGPLVVIVALAIWAVASGAVQHLSLEELQSRRAELTGFVGLHPWASLGTFMALYVVVISLSLPGALVLTLAGGFLFGPWLGAAAAVISATIGSTIIFLICRTAFGEALAASAGPGLAKLQEGLRRNAFSYILTLRLIPVVPLFVINIAAGLVALPLRTFVIASLIGMAPGSLVYAGLGAGLGAVFAKGQQPNLRLIFEPQILYPLLGLAALSLLPVLWQAITGRKAMS